MFEENLGLPRYFKVQKTCFEGIGITFTSYERIIISYFWVIVPVICKITFFLAIVHYVALHLSDVDDVVEAMAPCLQIFLSIIKWFTFMYKRVEISNLVKSIWAWNLESNEVERAILVKENKKDIRFCWIYFVVVSTAGGLAVGKPVAIGLVTWILRGHFPLLTQFKATYPLDNEVPAYFWLQYVWFLLLVLCAVYTTVGVDSLFSWITHNVIAQFGVLQLRYRHIASEHGGKVSKQSIIECVQYHRRIIDIVQELNDVLGLIIFVKFTISCLQICVLAYRVNSVNNFAERIFQFFFLLSIALQLILYCTNGQRLQDESSNVCNYIYEAFEWEKLDVKCQKLLLISMMRAKRVCQLSGIFFVVNQPLYLWVLRTAGSYITLLLSMHNEREEP